MSIKNEITITTPYIKLDQILKLSGIASEGSEAKLIIAKNHVKVNGEPETKRGKKLYPGDKVTVEFDYNDYELSVCD